MRGTRRPEIPITAVMEYPRLPASVRLDARELDHLAPLLDFFGDQLSELSRRSRQRQAAEVSETGLHLGVGERRVDLLVELLDDLGRRGLRCTDAVPGARLVARYKLTHGWDVRQRVRARGGGYCERPQPTSPDIPNRCDSGDEVDLHLPTEQIIERRPATTIGHVNHILRQAQLQFHPRYRASR